jgi:hypothetical protein
MIRLTIHRDHAGSTHPEVLTKVFESADEAAVWLADDSKFKEPCTRLAIWERIER